MPGSTGAAAGCSATSKKRSTWAWVWRRRVVQQAAQQSGGILEIGLGTLDLRLACSAQVLHDLHLQRPLAGDDLAADFEPLFAAAVASAAPGGVVSSVRRMPSFARRLRGRWPAAAAMPRAATDLAKLPEHLKLRCWASTNCCTRCCAVPVQVPEANITRPDGPALPGGFLALHRIDEGHQRPGDARIHGHIGQMEDQLQQRGNRRLNAATASCAVVWH